MNKLTMNKLTMSRMESAQNWQRLPRACAHVRLIVICGTSKPHLLTVLHYQCLFCTNPLAFGAAPVLRTFARKAQSDILYLEKQSGQNRVQPLGMTAHHKAYFCYIILLNFWVFIQGSYVRCLGIFCYK